MDLVTRSFHWSYRSSETSISKGDRFMINGIEAVVDTFYLHEYEGEDAGGVADFPIDASTIDQLSCVIAALEDKWLTIAVEDIPVVKRRIQ